MAKPKAKAKSSEAPADLAAALAVERNLTLEVVRVTEAAAIAAAGWVGLGDEQAADMAAAKAMHAALAQLAIEGRVAIGEGEKGETELLYTDEMIGLGQGPRIDIALEPLEGTTITAKGLQNALTVMAIAGENGFLRVPNVYMEKIAVGAGLPAGIVDLDRKPQENLQALAEARKVAVSDLTVSILDRPRHADLIQAVRETGARISLLSDGDIAGVIATTDSDTGIDIYMGSGGAPEGVLAAAALRCIGGQMQGRLMLRNDDERARARGLGIQQLDRKYELHELAAGEVIFVATGVTDGTLLRGVKRVPGGHRVHSIVMRTQTGTIRRIDATIPAAKA